MLAFDRLLTALATCKAPEYATIFLIVSALKIGTADYITDKKVPKSNKIYL
jgi:hypothetical protein